MLAYYEIQVHPYQTWERNRSSFLLLDSLIRLFSLTTLDADLPGARFSLFALQNTTPPTVNSSLDVREVAELITNGSASILPPDPLSHHHPGPTGAGCSCAQFTLRQQWPVVLAVAPLWEATAMWPSRFTEGEIRKEECRRLVWSSVMLAAGHNSYTSARFDAEKADLYIKHYDNVGAITIPLCIAEASHADTAHSAFHPSTRSCSPERRSRTQGRPSPRTTSGRYTYAPCFYGIPESV